jgi:hypothetical protein
MTVFDDAFGVPAGHMLREVRSEATARGPSRQAWAWEYEEYDERGVLMAIYESWTSGPVPPDLAVAGRTWRWVKYSPYGWVLQRSGIPSGGCGDGGAAWAEAA